MARNYDAFPATPKDTFDCIDPKDGYHVHKVEFATLLSLYVTEYQQGERVDRGDDSTLLIAEVENPTGAQHGAINRLCLALDAVARYLTTGGTWEELIGAMQHMKKLAAGGYTFPGYHLSDSYSTTEGGEYQHIFVKDGTKDAVVWEEPAHGANGNVVGGWFDRTTLDKLAEDLDENTVKRRIVAESPEGDTGEGDVPD